MSKNNNVDMSLIDSFSKVFQSTLRIKKEYKNSPYHRLNRGNMLIERYEELYDTACLLQRFLEVQKVRYSPETLNSTIINCDSNRLLSLIRASLEQSEEYEIATFPYHPSFIDEEQTEREMTLLSTREGLELMGIAGVYDFQRTECLRKLKELRIPFIVCDPYVNRHTFGNDVGVLCTRDLDGSDNGVHELCYEGEDISKTIAAIRSYAEVNSSDFSDIDDKTLVSLIVNEKKQRALKLGQ